MKKSSFIALILGTASGIFFAIGMCMALLPQWNAFWTGVIFGGMGLALGMITLLVWRKMTRKAPIHLSGKTLLAIAVGVIGTLLLGVGMCFCMVWNQLIAGILIGITGILVLLSLIPILCGLKD